MATKKQTGRRQTGATAPFRPLGFGQAEFLKRLAPLIDAGDFDAAASLARGQAARNPRDYDTQLAFGMALAYTSRFDEAAPVLSGLYHRHRDRAALDSHLFWATMCALVKTSPPDAVRFVEQRVGDRTISAVQGYRWIRYIGQFVGDFEMVRQVSEKFISSWADVFPSIPELHRAEGTIRFPAIMPTFPAYSGGAIDGRTLVVYDGSGFGDCFFSVRWLPAIGELSRAARVVFVVRPELRAFAKCFGTGAAIVERGEHEYMPDGPASFSSLVSLTTLIAPRIEDFWNGPYISAPTALGESWRRQLEAVCAAGTLRVGIVWAAGHIGVESLSWRNMPPETFTPLSRIAGVALVSLQKGYGDDGYAAVPGAISFAPEIGSFEDTAAIIANLDLVITVDCGVSNLAGAMGARVWVLLEPMHDGRYGLADSSDFYPTMRVFRARTRGDWTGVIIEVADALREVLAERRTARGV